MDIAVVGSNMVDLVSYVTRMPEDGETIEAPEFAIGPGGKGANQATAAARLGAQVVMVTRVGDDVFGPTTRANFEANGIATHRVLTTPGSSGVAPIFVDPQGRNRILIIKGANAKLSPADVHDARDDLAAARLIVLQLEIPVETVYATIELATELGVPVLLNPAPADPTLDLAAIATVTWFVPNETELALLTGLPTQTDAQVRAAAQVLLDAGLRNVVVTLGARGVLWLHSDGEAYVAAEPVAPVDTTGAGDAFIGAFTAHLTRDGGCADGSDADAVIAALRYANRYAADSVTRRGTQSSYATREQFGA